MKQIQDYILKTKSAVQRLYEAYYSYYELMEVPERPVFTFWGEPDSEENKIAYEKWQKENQEILQERHKRDNEFAFEYFARSTLCGSILQFAYNGIKLFSSNSMIPNDFQEVIRPKSIAAKFCVGKLIDNIPIGLIVFAGRNQAMHYDDDNLKEPSKTVFNKLANWYSPTFKKWFVSPYFDLNDKNLIHYAENILYKLEWLNYNMYEKDLMQLFTNKKAI